jgi:hypothetical protein
MATAPTATLDKSAVNNSICDHSVKKTMIDLIDQLNTVANAGAKTGATVVATEQMGAVHQTVIQLNATPITITDTGVGGGVKIYTMPQGRILVLGTMATVAFTTTSVLASTLNTGVTLNWGLGTVITAAQASGTLATTQVDLLPSTAATASATINVAGAAANGQLAAAAQFDGTTTAIPVHLNVGVATATDIDADATVTATGTVVITWINLGDY